MHTEEEAKKLWCPMVQWYGNASRYEDVFDNRGTVEKCIATDCAMWRWLEPAEYKKTDKEWSCPHCEGKGTAEKFICTDPEQPERNNPTGWCYECEGKGRGFVNARVGYCGLAGKPC